MNPGQKFPLVGNGKPASKPRPLPSTVEIPVSRLTTLFEELSPVQQQVLFRSDVRQSNKGFYEKNSYILVGSDSFLASLIQGVIFQLRSQQPGQQIVDVIILENRSFFDPVTTTTRYFLLLGADDETNETALLNLLGEHALDVLIDNNLAGQIATGRGNHSGSDAEGPGNHSGSDAGNAVGFGLFTIDPGTANILGLGGAFPELPGGTVDLSQIVTSETCTPPGNAVRVAVLDSGIYTVPMPLPALPVGCLGWLIKILQWLIGLLGVPAAQPSLHIGKDFVNNDAIANDDHWHLHGTRVSTLIREQCAEAEILPVKVSNERGVCTLYDVLCGLEYARIQQARVVNMSLVFLSTQQPVLAQTDQDIQYTYPLLRWMIDELAARNCWVVAAAGNRVNETDPGQIGQNVPYTYPACYSSMDDATTASNLISVTTVKADVDKGAELTSNKYIDIGVRADLGRIFQVPGFSEARSGTSYATPHITGRLAHYLHTRTQTGESPDKEQFLLSLAPQVPTELSSDIKGGRVIPT